MVQTAAAQQRLSAVDEEALRAPADLPDAEADFRFIKAVRHPCGIERGAVLAPESRVRDAQREVGAAAADALHREADLLPALHADDRRVQRDGAHADALRGDAPGGPGPEPDRAVDPRTGIPAGIRLIEILAVDPDHVFPVDQERVRVDEEGQVTICCPTGKPVVEIDPRIFIHAFKLQQDMFRLRP